MKMLYVFLTSRGFCVHYVSVLFYLVILIIFGEEYKLYALVAVYYNCARSLSSFLSLCLGPNLLLSVLFSDTAK